MIRKTIFIAIVVLLVFFIYRGFSPSGADKIVNKISSIRQKNITNQTGTTYTGGNIISGTLLSGSENSYERLTQEGTFKNLSGTSETWNTTGAANTGNRKTPVNNTGNTSTGNTNTGTTAKPPVKTTSTTKTTTQTSTNTNGLSQQDMKDLNELLNNIVE